MWLDSAEMFLRMGEQSFESLEKTFARFGGAENVKVIG